MTKKLMIGLLFIILVSLQCQFAYSKTRNGREDFNSKRFVDLEGLWVLDNAQHDKQFFKNEKRFVFLYFSEMQVREYKPKVVTKTSTVRSSNPAGGYQITNKRDYVVRDGSLPANLRINGQYQLSTMQILSFDNLSNVVHDSYPACVYFLGTAKLPTLTICQGNGPSMDFFTPLSIQPNKSKSKGSPSYWLQANNRNYFVMRKPTMSEFVLFMAVRRGRFNFFRSDNEFQTLVESSLGTVKPDVLDKMEEDIQQMQRNEDTREAKTDEYIEKINMEQIPKISGLWFHLHNNSSEELFKGEKRFTFFYFPKVEYLTTYGYMNNYAELPENLHFWGLFAQSDCHIITFDNEGDIEYRKLGACLYRHGFPILPTMSLFDNSTKKADSDFTANLTYKKKSVILSFEDGSKYNAKLLALSKGNKNYSLITPTEQIMKLFFLAAMNYQQSSKTKKKILEESFLNTIPQFGTFKKKYEKSSKQPDWESVLRSSIKATDLDRVEIIPREE